MQIAIWLTALFLLGIWSLTTWGVITLMTLDPSWVAAANLWLLKLPFGHWLDQWLPGWQAAASALLEITQALLSWLGSVGPWLALALWAAGAACMLTVAGLSSLLVALVSRATRPAPPTHVPETANSSAR